METTKRSKIWAYVVVAIGILWTALPLYWMVITAFKSQRDPVDPPTFFPQIFSSAGFVEAWTHGGARGVKDSAIIAVGTLIISLVLGLPMAYAISAQNGAAITYRLPFCRFASCRQSHRR